MRRFLNPQPWNARALTISAYILKEWKSAVFLLSSSSPSSIHHPQPTLRFGFCIFASNSPLHLTLATLRSPINSRLPRLHSQHDGQESRSPSVECGSCLGNQTWPEHGFRELPRITWTAHSILTFHIRSYALISLRSRLYTHMTDVS